MDESIVFRHICDRTKDMLSTLHTMSYLAELRELLIVPSVSNDEAGTTCIPPFFFPTQKRLDVSSTSRRYQCCQIFRVRLRRIDTRQDMDAKLCTVQWRLTILTYINNLTFSKSSTQQTQSMQNTEAD